MRLKMIGISATIASFVVCSMLCSLPKENKEQEISEITKTNIESIETVGRVQEITVTDIESIQDANNAKEINIVFVGNEETKVTPEEYRLLLRVCMSECGGKYGEPLEGKIAVVETILNRSEIYGKTIEEVVYEPNQYSVADNGEPDETVREAVDIALSSNTYPDDMIYFRAGYYHSFGTPYRQIGNHYFSLKGE